MITVNKRKVKEGGLMRCCLATLQERDEEDKEGQIINCKYCGDKMFFNGIYWEWYNDPK